MVQMILRFLPAVLLLARILIGIDILYRRRAVAMRSLALKYGFDFTAGPSWYDLRKQTPAAESFRLRGHPVDTLRKTWNLVEGSRNGLHVLILDSIDVQWRPKSGEGRDNFSHSELSPVKRGYG
jgi:hypothetical protein